MKSTLVRFFVKCFPVLITLFFISSADAQNIKIKVDTVVSTKTSTMRIVTTWTAPRLIIQINGGLSFGAFEMQGHNGGFSRLDFLFGRNFGARNGFGGNITGKYAINKSRNFYVSLGGGFTRFQSSLFAKNEEEGNVSYNVMNGMLGADYFINSTHKVKYFLGAGANFSMISGKALLVSYDNGDSVREETNVKIKSSMRIGYTVYAGIDYAVSNQFGVNAGVKWTHANLLMKKAKEEPNINEIELNDMSTNPPTFFTGWKQFAYTSVFAGVSIYFGVKQMRYKLPN